MNSRSVSIVRKLVSSDEMTLSGLAASAEVSERTIRNDLDEISAFLTSKGLSAPCYSSGGRVSLSDNPAEVETALLSLGFDSYHLSREERTVCAAILLVSNSGYLTLSQIADTLLVSKTTIIKEIDDIKAFITGSGLEAVSYPSKGIRVDGAESAKRAFLLKLLASVEGEDRQDSLDRQLPVQAGDRIVIRKLLSEQELRHGCSFSEDSFHELVIYLRIMVSRNLQGEFMEAQPVDENDAYLMAQDILRSVSQYCGITTTVDEVRYLSLLLDGARYLKRSGGRRDAPRVQVLTRRFIERISDELGCDLNGDFEFFENLSNHLDSVLRPEPVNYPDTPVIHEVIEDNSDVLEAVRSCDAIISTFAGRELTELEIDYIVLHVCAALERKKNKEIAFHVALVCGAGIGTSQLLLEKLKKHFNFRIVDILSSHEVGSINPKDVDLVISTVPLRHCKIDHVVVSPLLTDEDYIHVGAKIDTLRNSRNLPSRIEDEVPSAKGLIDRLAPAVREADPGHAPAVMKAVRRVVRDYFREPCTVADDVLSPYLHQLLPGSHIRLDVACDDWRDAVRASAQVLLDEGYIEPSYIDAMIANIEENGPYVVLSKGFAVPHEGIDQGSLETGMSLIRLTAPVPFDADELDPVEFVCCMSAPDHKTHLKAFFNLVNLLRDDAFKESLRQAVTPADAASAIERFEYSLS